MSGKRYGRGDGLLGAVLQTLPGKLASHWLVQGMAYMDATERAFKLALDAGATVAVGLALVFVGLPLPGALGLGFLIAHTANFLFNGHLRGALKWHGLGGVPRRVVEHELRRIAERLTANPAISQAFVYGSLSRGELHDGSDLDIRVIRRTGLRAALGACVAVLLERTRSLASGVPLDIYVWDSVAHLERMRADEGRIDMRDIAQASTVIGAGGVDRAGATE